MHAFRDVETAAYCPRKLYYRKRSPETDSTPESVQKRRELAFEYDRLLSGERELRQEPIEVTPTTFRSRIGCTRASLDCWDELADPTARDVFVRGRECQGVVHKVLETEPPTLSLCFGGRPPGQGVWKPQSVRLVAAAKALSWERELEIERAFAEYPAHGVVREVEMSTRRVAAYRAAVRTADAIDGPPPRTSNRSKCEPCGFRADCGVKTRSLRSLLGS